jgi:hypothetical protein
MKFIYRVFIQVGIILGFVGTIVVNTLSSLGLINGTTPEFLSDQLENYFVPAGLTFTVWGLIYIGLLAFTIYSTIELFKKKQEEDYFINKMGIEFIIASIANIAWIFLWHYQAAGNFMVVFSLIAMLVLLASLLTMYIRLKVGKEDVSAKEKWFVHIPISLYLGWITIATVANATAVLVDLEMNKSLFAGFWLTEEYWTNLMLIIATIITLLMLYIRKDIAYSLIVIWAFAGIILRRIETTIVLEIITTAAIGIGLIVIMISYTAYRLIKTKS